VGGHRIQKETSCLTLDLANRSKVWLRGQYLRFVKKRVFAEDRLYLMVRQENVFVSMACWGFCTKAAVICEGLIAHVCTFCFPWMR
jgi:hypothetical protein